MSEAHIEPSTGAVLPFEAWDFESVAEGRAKNPEYNEKRLLARRRLLALGKAAVVRAKAGGLALEARSSIHNPHPVNGNRVTRLWTYLVRPKAEKTRLKRVLGAELAKDLDQAYKNLYLAIALEEGFLEVSLRIHPDAWYDGQNLVRRVRAGGLRDWLALLNARSGYRLRLADWKGEWRCGELSPEALEDYLLSYKPGDHLLAVERRWPVPKDPSARAAVLTPEVPALLVEEVLGLVPLYRFMAWSNESDFLFAGG